jgi:hypothetical protein
MSITKVIMTIKHGLHPFFLLIDIEVTTKIPWPQLYHFVAVNVTSDISFL